MQVYNKYLDQQVAGTEVDAHGEKRTKEFFEKLINSYPPRLPLTQQHDMSKETLGYLENFRLIPSKNVQGEWSLIADIYITSDDIDEALKGFSISVTETIGGNTTSPKYYVHLPFPLYNDKEFIESLIGSDKDLLVGKLIKKSVDPVAIGLITASVALILGPEWDIQYKRHVRPAMGKLLEHIPKLLQRNVSPDLIQHVVGKLDEAIKVYFIPDRRDIIGSYEEKYILQAIGEVGEFLNGDSKAGITGVGMIKLYFDRDNRKYILFHVQYLDGADVQIA